MSTHPDRSTNTPTDDIPNGTVLNPEPESDNAASREGAREDANEDAREADKMGLERLVFFSDAVFAIAITLLALDIRLPAEVTGHELNAANTFSLLLSIWPKYIGYMLSFLVIGSVWLGHHTKFRYIRRFDSRLLWLNLLLLMGVGFIPFPTSLLSEYRNAASTIFYAGTMVCIGLFSTAIWAYASHNNRLVDADLSPVIRRSGFIGPLLAPAVFLVSILIALINDTWARTFWILILPLSIYVH